MRAVGLTLIAGSCRFVMLPLVEVGSIEFLFILQDFVFLNVSVYVFLFQHEGLLFSINCENDQRYIFFFLVNTNKLFKKKKKGKKMRKEFDF